MKRRLRVERIIQAAVGGPLVGGLLVGLWFVLRTLSDVVLSTLSPETAVLLVAHTLLVITIATFAFDVGVLVVGLPLWWGLNRLGQTGPSSAATVGGVATTLGAWVLWGCPMETSALANILLLGLDGAIVGWIIQRVAYEPIHDGE